MPKRGNLLSHAMVGSFAAIAAGLATYIFMIGQRSVDGMAQRPGWQSIRALREKRVCVFTSEQANVLVRPGPRMAEGARLMAQCLTDKAPHVPSAPNPKTAKP